MPKSEIQSLSTQALKSLVASTNPFGSYGREVLWSVEELHRRGVDFSDCIDASWPSWLRAA